jgi:hypothetical protein
MASPELAIPGAPAMGLSSPAHVLPSTPGAGTHHPAPGVFDALNPPPGARGRRGDADQRPRLRELLAAADPAAPVVVAELVPWAGALDDPAGERTRKLAADLEADPRVSALSITDNAGGHARLSPEVLARELIGRGRRVIVHVTCRDRNRSELLSLGWRLQTRGSRTCSSSRATTRPAAISARAFGRDRSSRPYRLAADVLTGVDLYGMEFITAFRAGELAGEV